MFGKSTKRVVASHTKCYLFINCIQVLKNIYKSSNEHHVQYRNKFFTITQKQMQTHEVRVVLVLGFSQTLQKDNQTVINRITEEY